MALDEARIPIVVDATGAIQLLGRTESATDAVKQSAEELAAAQAALNLELKAVEQSLRALQKQYQQHTAPEVRAEITKQAAAYEQQRRALQQQAKALQDTGKAQDQLNRRVGGGNQLLLEFGRFANDSQQFAYGFRQGLIAVSNQVDGLSYSLRRMNEQAQASGRTLGQELLSQLKGPAGMIALLNVAATAAILFGDKIIEAFQGAVDKGRAAREDLESILDTMLEINRLDLSFSLDEAKLEQAIEGVKARIAELRAPLDEEDTAISVAVGTLGPAGQKALQQIEDSALNRVLLTKEERQEAENQVTAREALLAKLESELELTRDIQLANEAIAETGAEREETAEERKRRLAAERAAEKERRELARLTASIRADLDKATLEQIAEGRERDLAALRQWYDKRVEEAEGHAELLAIVEETRTLREAQINEKYRAEAERKERDFQEKLRDLRDQYAVASGASEAAVLQATIVRLDRTIEAEQEGTDEYRRLVLEREKLAVRLANVQAREAERAAREVEKAEREAAREAERAYDARLRVAERYTRALMDALDAAIFYERRYTDASIALTKKRFDEERAALEERRALGEDVNADLRALAEDRAAFERQAAEDAAGAITRSLLSIVEAAKKAALDYIKTALAKAAAEQVVKVIGTVPFPINIAIAGGALAAVFGLEGVIRKAAGFAGGGFVGSPGERGHDTVPIVVGRGEAVLNRHQQHYVEDALQRTYGIDLDGLFRRVTRPHFFATGGFAGVATPARPPAARSTGSGFVPGTGGDASANLVRELRALRAEVRASGARVERSVGNPHAARRMQRLTARLERAIDPHRGALSP